jgi:hypothetical protein
VNEFVAANPGVTVVLMGGLVSLCSAAISLILWLGYIHTMRRFDTIDGDEATNRKEHKEITGRLVRLETLVINGGKQ